MRVGPKALRLPTILTLVGACALGGCYYPGGPLYSADRFTYESTTWQPWSVTMIDTRTGEAVWSVDVPVGEQVVLSFSKGTGPNEFKPDEIVWALMPAGQRGGSRPNRMPCPPAGARRLDSVLRPVPEAPGATGPGGVAGEPRKIRNLGLGVTQPINPPVDSSRPVSPSEPVPTSGPAVEPPPSHPAPAPEPVPVPSGDPTLDRPAPAPADQPSPPSEVPPAPPSEPAPEPVDIPE